MIATINDTVTQTATKDCFLSRALERNAKTSDGRVKALSKWHDSELPQTVVI